MWLIKLLTAFQQNLPSIFLMIFELKLNCGFKKPVLFDLISIYVTLNVKITQVDSLFLGAALILLNIMILVPTFSPFHLTCPQCVVITDSYLIIYGLLLLELFRCRFEIFTICFKICIFFWIYRNIHKHFKTDCIMKLKEIKPLSYSDPLSSSVLHICFTNGHWCKYNSI